MKIKKYKHSMRNYYQCLIARMNGETVQRDFSHYRSLVEKGIGGFIIFGGSLTVIRRCVRDLQEEAAYPLIIASDLERGLGQQLKGGTDFPPAMAVASAVSSRGASGIGRGGKAVLRDVFGAVAEEAAYAGINTVFAPVLDINTNRRNPIIATRAFGEDRETVSSMGCEMVRVFMRKGIIPCGKHFPGHGDTEVDSHIRLPSITRGLGSLRTREMVPFRRAIDAGLPMIMLGHLNVPALDPAGIPVSLSEKAVGFIRKEMDYQGILITDAMNMGGIGRYTEEEASFMALNAGVDLILHPSDAEEVVSYLKKAKATVDVSRLEVFRSNLFRRPAGKRPEFVFNKKISDSVAVRSIRISGPVNIRNPFLIILNDDDAERGGGLVKRLKEGLPGLGCLILRRGEVLEEGEVPAERTLIAAVFSETKGWKGGASGWLFDAMSALDRRNAVFISFGSPYLLDHVRRAAKVRAFWDGDSAQAAVAKIIIRSSS